MGENVFLGLCVLLSCVTGGLLVFFYRQLRHLKAATRWKLVQGNALLFCFLLSLLMMAGELYFRFVFDSTDSLMYTKVSERWFDRYYHCNQANIRDNIEYVLPLAPGKRRVSFVGDSFTAGHGIKDVEKRFCNRIRRLHPEWDVHMLAMLGFETSDEEGYLRHCLSQGYQIDEVVLVYCLNDISDLLPERRAAISRLAADLDHSAWLWRNSYFFNTLHHRWRVAHVPFMRGYFDVVRDAYQDGPIWDQQKQRLLAFRNLVQANGGRLAVVTFPFLHALGPHYDYRSVHQRLDAFWHEAKVPHLDLLPLYEHLKREQLTLNSFDAHPNEYAHALATPVIEKFVAEQVLASSTNAARSRPLAAPH